MSKPSFVFFAPTYLHRSENFLHRQLTGMKSAKVSVLALRGKNISEFPVDELFLAEGRPRSPRRAVTAIRRRLTRGRRNTFEFEPFIVERIGAYLRRVKPDLAYSIFAWNAIRFLRLIDAAKMQVPLVFLAGGSDITTALTRGPEYLAEMRNLFDRAELILAGSSFLRSKLLELGAPAEKVRLQYIGVDVPPGVSACRPKTDVIKVLAVARLVPVKGLRHCIGALDYARREFPAVHLTVIGDGSERDDCQHLVRRLDLEDHVTFLGARPLSTVYAQMACADLFIQHNICLPDGQEESIGGSILEACAHALPVIVSNSGGVGEAVQQNVTGVLVEPGNEREMGRQMVRLCRSADLRLRLGSAARSLIEHRFNLVKQNDLLEATLMAVIRRGIQQERDAGRREAALEGESKGIDRSDGQFSTGARGGPEC